MNTKSKQQKRNIRHKRVKARIFGTSRRPRLSVFRSNKHIYLQAIDDEKGKTMASASDLNLSGPNKSKEKRKKIEAAKMVGEQLAKKLAVQKIKKAVFDRGGYKYHGRVKTAAEGARAGGLEF